MQKNLKSAMRGVSISDGTSAAGIDPVPETPDVAHPVTVAIRSEARTIATSMVDGKFLRFMAVV
ncbi:MAG: hypothetical protein ACOX6K_06760 [Sphaerochaetaceae bacterium]